MVWTLSTASAASPEVICEPVKHCVSILKTHDADSFDYEVLRSEFVRYGEAGKQALLKMASGRDDAQSQRALMILSENYILSSNDVATLTELWPKRNLTSLTYIFSRNANAKTRQVAIDTLGHLDSKVRASSRDVIAASFGVRNLVQSTDFTKLAQAIVTEPTPELLALINQFDTSKTTPLYVRSLNNDNPAIVMTAYEYLYASDKALALNSLIETLMGLRDDEVESALAISRLLTTRHKNRPDGFYLQFASDISKDTNISRSGRVAGLDALIRSQNLPDVPTIENTSEQHNNLRHIFDVSEDLHPDYINNLAKVTGDNPDFWLSIFWSKLKTDTSQKKAEFIYQAGRYDTPLAKEIIVEALSDKHDWRVIAAAMQAAAAQRNEDALSQLEAIAPAHPISKVRASADMALSAIKSRRIDTDKLLTPVTLKQVGRINRKTQYCRIPKTDLYKNARKLPFFDEVEIKSDRKTARYKLTSAEPTQSGWLAGYDLGHTDGGLIYFDNVSGQGDVLLDASVMAVVPVQRPPLGQTASRFWVITKQSKDMPNGSMIYHVNRTANNTDMKLHATLPNVPDYISENPEGDVFIAFKNSESANVLHVNPPLLLSPNGAIIRACEATVKKANFEN